LLFGLDALNNEAQFEFAIDFEIFVPLQILLQALQQVLNKTL